jgi:uncharacterized protein YjbI with pentapeptide repeats
MERKVGAQLGESRRRFARVAVLAALGALLGMALPSIPSNAADCRAMPAASVDWQGCRKSALLLPDSMLDRALLADTDLSGTDLRNSSLIEADLEKATLIRTSLAGSRADSANFSRIEGYRTLFTGASARGASFASAELQRADFSGADVTGADFQKSELGRANFKGATITGTSFAFANLARAEFQGAKFEGPIDFTKAFTLITRFDGVDLSQAKGLTQVQIDYACGTAETKLPEGLKPGANWPCSFEFD